MISVNIEYALQQLIFACEKCAFLDSFVISPNIGLFCFVYVLRRVVYVEHPNQMSLGDK